MRHARPAGQGLNHLHLVRLRAAWPRGEWAGPWSPADPLWAAYPDVAEVAMHANKCIL